MQLKRPLVTIDEEATGLELTRDRIVSIYMFRDNPDGTTREWEGMFNPGFPMDPKVIEIHGITDSMVADKPDFKERAKEVFDFISGCDLAGFNICGFDAPMLHEEFWRAGIDWDVSGIAFLDAGTIFKVKEPRGLEAAVPFYCKRKHEGAHGAKADVLATRDVLNAQLNRYEDLMDMDAKALSEFCATDKNGNRRLDLGGTIVLSTNGVPVFGTKRNRGVPLTSDIGYCNWILRSDFPRNTKQVIERILEDNA